MSRAPFPRESRTCAREGCSESFEVRLGARDAERRFCSRPCARQVENQARSAIKQQEWLESPASLCPCGDNRIPYGIRHTTKYCSTECRTQYGKRRQADPKNYVTFGCLNCGIEVTRYKNYGNGHNKYCSNACAQKHTKIKKHIIVEDATVLDSLWEGLFWCLCGFAKIPVERFDREQGVEWREGCWYAPDFWLPVLGIAVEVKGREDENDASRWKKFNRPLIVVGREELDMLRKADDVAQAIQSLVQSGDGA
jgi:hypothetical protein